MQDTGFIIQGAALGGGNHCSLQSYAVHGPFFRVKNGRINYWLCPTKILWPTDRSQSQKVTLSDHFFWERSVSHKIFTLTPTRPFSHERTGREPRSVVQRNSMVWYTRGQYGAI